MKLSVVRGGGLAGMVTHTEVVDQTLSDKDAKTLRDNVTQAGLFELPQSLTPEKSYPDDLRYEVTIENEGQRHTVRMTEATMPESVRLLIAWIDSVPERKERVEPLGKTAR